MMAACKDCLHSFVCWKSMQVEKDNLPCSDFADRSKYAVREKSEWILNNNGSATCKRCHRTTKDAWDFDNWLNFCPNCGADMRKG